MLAVTREFPNQVLFSYWLNSINAKAERVSNPDAILATGTLQNLAANGDFRAIASDGH